MTFPRNADCQSAVMQNGFLRLLGPASPRAAARSADFQVCRIAGFQTCVPPEPLSGRDLSALPFNAKTQNRTAAKQNKTLLRASAPLRLCVKPRTSKLNVGAYLDLVGRTLLPWSLTLGIGTSN